MATVRICVCGDESSGKSSLITGLVKDVFVTNRIQSVLPQITIPPSFSTPENVTTTVVDTSASPADRASLDREIRQCNVVLLVYAGHYGYERIALFWLPHLRSLIVDVPIVLCANKADLDKSASTEQVIQEEMLPLLSEFKEIDACIRTSAREHHNINEVFFLCQKAVTDPVAPLFDAKESCLKPAAVHALERIFHLCDHDQDGRLSDDEIQSFQSRCFGKPLGPSDLEHIKLSITRDLPEAATSAGISRRGFLHLNKLFAEKGRHETIWLILRTFHYSNDLSLDPHFVAPKFNVPADSSVELSPFGYRFLVDLFLLHDKDKDGELSSAELTSIFLSTAGPPKDWSQGRGFDAASSRADQKDLAFGKMSRQTWLAHWNMTTFFSPKSTLFHLAHLGYDPIDHDITNALVFTKPRRRLIKPHTQRGIRAAKTRTERNVLFAYVLGSSGCGKSSLLDGFVSLEPLPEHHPTNSPRTEVRSVELAGGRQCILILREPGSSTTTLLKDETRVCLADVIVYAFDSSDEKSFDQLLQIRKSYAYLNSLPSLFLALKADKDQCLQRAEYQPEEYTDLIGLRRPLHFSSNWHKDNPMETFVSIAEAALAPYTALPKTTTGDGDDTDDTSRDTFTYLAASGALVAVGAALWAVYRRITKI